LVTKYLIWDEHWILWSSIFLVIVVEVLFFCWKLKVSHFQSSKNSRDFTVFFVKW
jgi:hypothetical protein